MKFKVCVYLTLVHLLSLMEGENVSLQGVGSWIGFLAQVALELLHKFKLNSIKHEKSKVWVVLVLYFMII